MSRIKVDFASLPWEENATGVRSKTVVRGSKKLRLVEFTNEFTEQEWCFKSHIGYVLEGDLEITFSNETERLSAGDGIFLSGGDEDRHKAKAVGSSARLMLVEEVTDA